MTPEHDYIPYGPEWEKEMMKHQKPFLIDMIRKIKQESPDARQTAIGFAEWSFTNYHMTLSLVEETKMVWHPRYMALDRKYDFTTSELYDLYLIHLQ